MSGAPAASDAPACPACGARTTWWDLGDATALARCPTCGHVVRDLRFSSAPVRGHAWGGSAVFDRVRIAITMQRMRPLLPRGRRARILELGFGRGVMLREFLDAGHEIHGIEAGMLDVDIDPLVRERGTLYFGRAEDIDIPRDFFDLIYGVHVIEHLSDPQRVFDTLAAALAPGGKFYFVTPNAESMGLEIFRDTWWNLEDPTHLNFFSARSVTRMLERAGFHDVRVQIPILDSLTIEANSAVKRLFPASRRHGVMSNPLVKLLDVGLIAPTIVARAVAPRLSPSIDIRGTKRG
ncbi:MAG: class I SAM-dependent methyltransferase [Gemmatimonadaceae bacterium]